MSTKMPSEKTNSGLGGAPKRKIGSPGQSSDAGSKDELVGQHAQQVDSYHAKGSDFSVEDVPTGDGQSGKAGTAEGQDRLATLSSHQESPRSIEDSGDAQGSGGPTDWSSGGRSARVAAAFPIEQNKGESNLAGGEVSIKAYVDLQDGCTYVEGYSQSPFHETPKALGGSSLPSRS